jgi:Mg2+-importing ATPase
VTVGALLPASPLAHTLGFSPLPSGFFAALAGMVLAYLVLVEVVKRRFYRTARTTTPRLRRGYSRTRHLTRRAARFSTAEDGHRSDESDADPRRTQSRTWNETGSEAPHCASDRMRSGVKSRNSDAGT